jgi:tetratricopeptide (TPR) repeat protein
MESPIDDVSYRIDERTLRPIPNNPGAMAHAAVELQAQARSDGASARDRARALGRAGMYLALVGDFIAAEAALREAIELNGVVGDLRQSVVLRLRQGQVYQWQGRYAEADAVFGDVLKQCLADSGLSDYTSYALQHAGKCHFEQGRYGDATASFREALRLREQGNDESALESTRLALSQAERRRSAQGGS